MRKLDSSELQRKSIDEFKKSQKTPLIIILDDVRSLHNIGSVFRTADAFLIQKICLCGITASPPHKEIQKTALGATETVLWQHYENIVDCIDELKKSGVGVYAIEQTEQAVFLQNTTINSEKSYAIVFGNEVFGVSQTAISHCDGVIEIPQLGTKHSLNIAVSVGIVVWDFFKKLSFS